MSKVSSLLRQYYYEEYTNCSSQWTMSQLNPTTVRFLGFHLLYWNEIWYADRISTYQSCGTLHIICSEQSIGFDCNLFPSSCFLRKWGTLSSQHFRSWKSCLSRKDPRLIRIEQEKGQAHEGQCTLLGLPSHKHLFVVPNKRKSEFTAICGNYVIKSDVATTAMPSLSKKLPFDVKRVTLVPTNSSLTLQEESRKRTDIYGLTTRREPTWNLHILSVVERLFRENHFSQRRHIWSSLASHSPTL